MKRSIIVFLSAIMFSCISEKENKVLESQLVGKWSNVSLNVIIKGITKDSILVVKKGEWEKVMGIKPIVTTYSEDSTFKSEYYSLDDQLLQTAYGNWWLRNDSLIMNTENGQTAYRFSISNGEGNFKATLDWDMDGVNDDEYDGVQIKIE